MVIKEEVSVDNFLTYNQITKWAEREAQKNKGKVSVTLVDGKGHQKLSPSEFHQRMYKDGIPDYQRKFNLATKSQDKAVFHLAVKGYAIVIICEFMYPRANINNGFYEEKSGQLSMFAS